MNAPTASVSAPPLAWRGGSLPDRPTVMAILNVTPDSFFDGGRYDAVDAAVRRAWAVVDAGADLLDIGGESTRPGAAVVDTAEEQRRTEPVIRALVAAGYPLPISIDTTRAGVAAAALDAGAVIVNDVSGGLREPQILRVAAERGAAVVLMHMRGTPQTMQSHTDYADVVTEVRDALLARCAAATAAGIPVAHQAVDPGIGFAKSADGSAELVARIDALAPLGRPILVGASRKSFLGRLHGQEGEARLWGSVAVAAFAAEHGARILRVHDVAPTRAALDVIRDLVRRRDRVAALSHPAGTR